MTDPAKWRRPPFGGSAAAHARRRAALALALWLAWTAAPSVAQIPPPADRPGAAPSSPDELDTTQGFRGTGVQTLDDLRSMVIEGPAGAVDALAQIIQELDRLNIGSEAGIEVVRLLHTDAESLAVALRQVYESRDAARPPQLQSRGRVGFVPIAQPNAMIVVAPAPEVADVVRFVELLDRNSTAAGSQFRVFRLAKASAAAVRTRLLEFFAVRQDDANLRVRVEVVADDRTNSLIVYAGPNDLDQAARLIEQLDNDRNDAVNDLRVFPLKFAQAQSLADLLNQAITARGQAVGAVPGAPGASPAAPLQPGAAGPQKTTKLRLVVADAARRAVESGILEDVTVTADQRTNALVVTAPANTMDLLAALIEQLDQGPGVSQVVRVFTLQNSNAEELLQTLQQIFLGTAAQTGAPGAAPVQPAVQPAAGVGANQATLAIGALPIRFTPNYRTNSVIVTGSEEDIRRVEEIVAQIDSPETRQRETIVYRLNNLSAPAAVVALNDYLRRERLDTQITVVSIQSQSTGQEQAQEVVATGTGADQSAERTPLEPATNAIVITANAGFLGPFLRVVEEIDRRPPQVLIQVLIAQVVLDNNDEFGIEVGLQNDILFDRSLVVGPQQGGGGTSLNPGFNFNTVNPLQSPTGVNSSQVGLQNLTNFALGRASPLGYGGLIFAVSNENISVLLRALKRQRRLDVLSRPQVMALDNQQASIQVGQQIRVPTGSVTAPQGGTTSSFQAQNIGIILAVTPRIAPDGTILMRVAPQISSLERDSSGAIEGLPVGTNSDGTVVETPIINITQAVTTVASADGETVVLGGLITKDTAIEERKVPVLGDAPYINWLFKTRFRGVSKRELLIILTPHIVYNQIDADRIKQTETCRIDWILGNREELHGDIGVDCPPKDPRSNCIHDCYHPHGDGPLLNMPTSDVLPRSIPPHTRDKYPPAGQYQSLPSNGGQLDGWEGPIELVDPETLHPPEEIVVPVDPGSGSSARPAAPPPGAKVAAAPTEAGPVAPRPRPLAGSIQAVFGRTAAKNTDAAQK